MSISYEGIGEVCATFEGRDLTEGKIVKMSENNTVASCESGDSFCGVVAAVARDGKACSVRLGGFATVKYSGTMTVGYQNLAADGDDTVVVAESGGKPCLVVAVDENTATIQL